MAASLEVDQRVCRQLPYVVYVRLLMILVGIERLGQELIHPIPRGTPGCPVLALGGLVTPTLAERRVRPHHKINTGCPQRLQRPDQV